MHEDPPIQMERLAQMERLGQWQISGGPSTSSPFKSGDGDRPLEIALSSLNSALENHEKALIRLSERTRPYCGLAPDHDIPGFPSPGGSPLMETLSSYISRLSSMTNSVATLTDSIE